MTLYLSDIKRAQTMLSETADLARYLPPPLPAFQGEGGTYCICGAGVPYGSMHSHGGDRAFIATNPRFWFGMSEESYAL